MKPKRRTSPEDAKLILSNCTQGVLSMITPEGLPYGVMLNYIYDQGQNAIYFHCAKAGKKLDCLAHSASVSFFTLQSSQIIEERFTTHYASAVVTGQCCIVENDDERKLALTQIGDQLAPAGHYRLDDVIAKAWNNVTILRLDIENIEGKRNSEQ